jgi:hypothetical protein
VAIFDDIFPSHIIAKAMSDEPLTRNKMYVTQKGVVMSKLPFKPWIGGNVPGHMERLATALKNAMRSSKSSRESVTVDEWTKKVSIAVQWEWLAFLLILLILSLVLLVSIMIKTAGDSAIGA